MKKSVSLTATCLLAMFLSDAMGAQAVSTPAASSTAAKAPPSDVGCGLRCTTHSLGTRSDEPGIVGGGATAPAGKVAAKKPVAEKPTTLNTAAKKATMKRAATREQPAAPAAPAAPTQQPAP